MIIHAHCIGEHVDSRPVNMLWQVYRRKAALKMAAPIHVLPSSIEGKTPIGSKVVFNSFSDADGNDYYGVSLVYQSATQLRDNSMLDLDVPPMIVPLSFKGMSANKDGLYRKEDILGRLDKGISKYAEIVSLYQ